MKNRFLFICILVGLMSCKKEDNIRLGQPSPAVFFLKAINHTGEDLINNAGMGITEADITLEYLVDGERQPAPILPGGQPDSPKKLYGITEFADPNIFNGKVIYFEPAYWINDQHISTTYLTIKGYGTYVITTERPSVGSNTTLGKVWINGNLVRETISNETLVMNFVVN